MTTTSIYENEEPVTFDDLTEYNNNKFTKYQSGKITRASNIPDTLGKKSLSKQEISKVLRQMKLSRTLIESEEARSSTNSSTILSDMNNNITQFEAMHLSSLRF